MITKQKLVDGLTSGEMVLQLSEWGDGSRGVGLYYKGNNMPIERIAMQAWHIDQDDDTLIIADKEHEVWYYELFGAGSLSNQARKLLTDHCLSNEDTIIAWCNGDEQAFLPGAGVDIYLDVLGFSKLKSGSITRKDGNGVMPYKLRILTE